MNLSYSVVMEVLPTPTPEAGLVAIEAAFGVVVTLRDLAGTMRDADGQPLFPQVRNSHRRQAVCERGFAPACVAHCRRATNAACRATAKPFVQTCWKGVREVVVPLHRDGELIGYLFAGAWRGPDSPPGPWRTAWEGLPAWDPARATAVAAALSITGAGLLAASRIPAARPGSRGESIRLWVRRHLAGGGRAGLARHLGLTPTRTSHAVHEACGRSLSRLLLEERLARAKELLATTDLTVAEIGARVGWGDVPHFTRCFRRGAGAPPGRWRRQHREG